MSSKVIEVILTKMHRGAGVQNDPHRIVDQYYNLAGNLLFENDPKEISQTTLETLTKNEEVIKKYWTLFFQVKIKLDSLKTKFATIDRYKNPRNRQKAIDAAAICIKNLSELLESTDQ